MLTFRVPDIHCDGCIRSLTNAVHSLDAGATIQANLETKQVRVTTTATEAAVKEAFRDAGFDVET
jgi:copper chaperone